MQYLEAANADRDPAEPAGTSRIRLITVRAGPNRLVGDSDPGSSGTIFFNIDTYRAMQAELRPSAGRSPRLGARAVGSISSLVAGLLAYLEARGGGVWRAERNLEWKIATINFLGCILFAVSAVAGFTVPDTGDVLDLAVANVTTSLGALCFLVGAVLLLPEGNDVTT